MIHASQRSVENIDSEFKPEKFRELVVYICKKSEDDPTFGAIKLNKVLYYADFAAYRVLGKPITGAQYQKLHEGPAPQELLAARSVLINEGEARIETRPYFTGTQKRLVIEDGRDADLDMFAPAELPIVDEIIAYFHGKTAREVSDISHREPGWALAEDREIIPYETAWLSAEPISQDAKDKIEQAYTELMSNTD